MELYKNINNEALSEELRAKKIVLERLRRKIEGTDEKYVKVRVLEPDEKASLGKLILSFNNALDQLLYGDERLTDLGEVPYKYNLISFYLKKLPLTDLDEMDKRKIYDEMQRFIPKLNKLEEFANINNINDAFLAPLIKENILNKSFNTLTDLPVNYDNINKTKKKSGRPALTESQIITRSQKAAEKKAAAEAAKKAAADAKAAAAKAAAEEAAAAAAAAAAEEVAAEDAEEPQGQNDEEPADNEGSGKRKYKKAQWEMHSISIDKSMPLKEAKALAKKIFKEVPRVVEEQATTWHFNKNKKELFKKFRAHKVNDVINIIFGQLK